MSEFTPHFAPVVVLLFLGTVLLTGLSFLVLFYGAVQRSPFFAKIGAGAALTIAAGYLLLLGGVSVASTEKVLPAGGWKYFCEMLLVDDTGRSYEPSAEGQFAFARSGSNSTPMTQSLRPGESYTTDLVFDVPKNSRGLRLLLTEDDPETRFVIGHENSLLHKKIYFALDGAPPLTKTPGSTEYLSQKS